MGSNVIKNVEWKKILRKMTGKLNESAGQRRKVLFNTAYYIANQNITIANLKVYVNCWGKWTRFGSHV